MNFDVMPELHWAYSYPVTMAVMVATFGLTVHGLLRLQEKVRLQREGISGHLDGPDFFHGLCGEDAEDAGKPSIPL